MAKIVDKRPGASRVMFKVVGAGEWFCYGNTFYMKTNGCSDNAVNAHGAMTRFESTAQIDPVEVEIHLIK